MARDKIHDVVKNALGKAGWIITHDPYEIAYEDVQLFADLAARKPLGAEKDGEKIAIEVKSFLSRSPVYDFEQALGQYLLYRFFLQANDSERRIFLAMSRFAYQKVFQRKGLELARAHYQLNLVVIDIEREEILQWIE